jgi:hypothetical protein
MEEPMRSLVTGASGFIGSHLAGRLEKPVVVGRDARRLQKLLPGAEARQWNPAGEVDPGIFAGVEAVFHLAGESIFNGRWNRARKERIMGSRVEGTRSLVRALTQMERPPRVLVCSSAVGYYGSRGDEMLTESSGPGRDFLATVCMAWEEEARKAQAAGIRVVSVRTGVVLGADGGALARMRLPFSLGLGGRLGNGRQYMSWIHIDDLVGIFLHAARNDTVRGPINAVAPNPVTNREFTATLAAAVHRPALLHVPALALHAALGEFATVLLASQRAVPEKAVRTGYVFQYPHIRAAVTAALHP